MLKLLFIRHAESIGNCDGRMMGRADDQLTDRGEHQARSLGLALRQQLGWQPDRIYSSPQRRAYHTAELMRSVAYGATEAQDGQPAIVLDENLCEFDNGIFRGLTWPEAQRQYPELCQQLESSWDWIPIPEAESLEAGRSRAKAFLNAAIADLLQQSTQHATDTTGDATGDRGAWIVTHHWILQHLIAEIIGSCRTWQLEIPHTAAFEFWLRGSFWQPSDDLRFISHDPRQLNHVFWKIRAFNRIFVEIR
jgi:2,3-bisphosphoglycerate-dependent phosphoglycerate mutase